MKHFVAILTISFFSTSLVAEKTNVILEHSETLTFDKSKAEDAQLLKGNVRFRHDDAYMYCDSAYFYNKSNSFDAYGNVRVVQGDTLTVTSETMHYNGDTKVIQARTNVVMNNGQLILKTNMFDFYRDKNYGAYYGGGTIIDPQYTLTSERGYYYSISKKTAFKNDVKLINNSVTIESDTLLFDTQTNIASLVGPSHLYYNNYTVYTENGWSDTKKDEGALYDFSTIKSKNGKSITADTILFNREQGWTKAYNKVDMLDSLQKVIMRGDFGYFMQKPDKAYITKRAYAIKWDKGQDSLYIHADTLYFEQDDTSKLITGNYNVRFFKDDIQGKCDSIAFCTSDSILKMFVNPVIWSEDNQLSGDKIDIHFENNSPKLIHIQNNAFICSKNKANYYDQLSSKDAKGYISNEQLRQIDMINHARSIYFPEDENGEQLVNTAESNFMSIYLKDKKLEKILMKPEPHGVLYPFSKLEESDLYLRGFKWQEEIRPKSPTDIFRHTKN